MRIILPTVFPLIDDDDHDHDYDQIESRANLSLSLEESTGSNQIPHPSFKLKRKPRMRVISPTRFKRFKFSADDLVGLDDRLHDDVDGDEDDIVSSSEVEPVKDDMAAEDDGDLDIYGMDDSDIEDSLKISGNYIPPPKEKWAVRDLPIQLQVSKFGAKTSAFEEYHHKDDEIANDEIVGIDEDDDDPEVADDSDNDSEESTGSNYLPLSFQRKTRMHLILPIKCQSSKCSGLEVDELVDDGNDDQLYFIE